MASPIKITPVLTGASSKHFNATLLAQKDEKVSESEKKRITALVSKILSKKR